MMGLALIKEQDINGVYREDFELGLLQIGDFARIAEQRLTLRTDHSITVDYLKRKQEIEAMIHKITQINEHDNGET